jgi:hypothetical protein
MRKALAAIILALLSLTSCHQGEIDELEAQVERLRVENEQLRSVVADEHQRVNDLVEERDAATHSRHRLGECVSHTAVAVYSLAVSVQALSRPDDFGLCCADFSPLGSCADAPDPDLMRRMERQLNKANAYLSEVGAARFDRICMSEDSDPSDPRCRP